MRRLLRRWCIAIVVVALSLGAIAPTVSDREFVALASGCSSPAGQVGDWYWDAAQGAWFICQEVAPGVYAWRPAPPSEEPAGGVRCVDGVGGGVYWH